MKTSKIILAIIIGLIIIGLIDAFGFGATITIVCLVIAVSAIRTIINQTK